MNNSYEQWAHNQEMEWEARCTRCGACCGSKDDPCENLRQDASGQYFCAVYHNRFGQWHTVSGQKLTCIPIRDKLTQGHSWPGDEHCGYKAKPTYEVGEVFRP